MKDYMEARHQTVRKANELIQKSRFNLSLQQQKIILYLISKIKPNDEDFQMYEFDMIDFCRVCGIEVQSGKNYSDLKEAIREISDKSMWLELGDEKETETLVRWIEKPYISKKSGIVKIKLDKDLKPYLLQLKRNFTQYELIYTLHFKSKYTIRLYELIKSIHYHELEAYTREYTVDELKRLLDADTYTQYKDFKRRVLEPAVKEINEYSDNILEYKETKKRTKVVGISLTVKSKGAFERLKLESDLDKEMGIDPDQITIWDELEKTGGV
jgi:plasmid replication initiation protein